MYESQVIPPTCPTHRGIDLQFPFQRRSLSALVGIPILVVRVVLVSEPALLALRFLLFHRDLPRLGHPEHPRSTREEEVELAVARNDFVDASDNAILLWVTLSHFIDDA